MPVEVIMPKVDMDMTHGVLSAWHVAEGDRVVAGAPLFDIETDKAAMEVEAPAAGIVRHVVAAEGDRVPVGQPVAWIYAEHEAAGPPPQASGATPASAAEAEPTATAAATSATSATSATARVTPTSTPSMTPTAAADEAAATVRLRATPAARATARAAGLPLDAATGSGPLGRIQRADVAALERAAPAPQLWTAEPGPLHVSRRPGEGAPLLLIHGFASDSQSWAPFEKALGGGRPLVRIDLPGHGRSPRRRVAGFAALARMLVETFDDAMRGGAADGGGAHLVGHSLGGALALALADIRPRRVASLTLIAPVGLGPEIDAAVLHGVARARSEASLGPWLRRLTADPDRIDDAYVRAAMRSRGDAQVRACQREMADALFPDGTQGFDLRAALERVTAPAQIIWGRADRIAPWRHALAAPGEFAMHLLRDVGHVPQLECADVVGRIVARHVAATSAFDQR